MVTVAKVNLYGRTVGNLLWDDNRRIARFEYLPDFAAGNLEPSPLMMPLRQGYIYSFPKSETPTYRGLPGMFADSLPDTYGRAIFEKWLALTGRTSSNPVESLCFLGKDASEIIDCIYETAHRWPQMAYDSGVPSDIVNLIVKNSYETFDNNH